MAVLATAGKSEGRSKPVLLQETSITIIVDNKAGEGLASEHGLSLWIEAGSKCILFDTGQGAAFESNVRTLGIDLSRTDLLVLSHGHYDHTGGLAHVLEKAPGVEVYCHPAVTRPRYTIRDGKATAIGMPEKAVTALGRVPDERLHWVTEPCLLVGADRLDGDVPLAGLAGPLRQVGLTSPVPRVGLTGLALPISLSGPIPRRTSYEDTGGPFFLDPRGCEADPLEDDLAVWIHTDQGLVVCLGCCHAGLINTLDHIGRLAGAESGAVAAVQSGAIAAVQSEVGAGAGPAKPVRFRAIIGGLHLVNASPERLERTIGELERLSPDLLVACHCSGDAAVAALREALGERVVTGAAGMSFRF